MTLDETRQLGIEFERRVQVMIPEKEIVEKLDTETIYSFLNQYQDKFIHEIYVSLDNIKNSPKPSEYVESILQGLLSTEDILIHESDYNANIYEGTLPEDFWLYLSSFTKVNESFSYKNNKQFSGILQNTTISRSQLAEHMRTTYDSMRILRKPLVCFDKDRRINVLCDRYTTPTAINLSYYRVPKYMNIIESIPCELPIEVFETLVSGAIDLYTEFVYGAEERRKKQIQQAQQRAREDQRDARRSGKEED